MSIFNIFSQKIDLQRIEPPNWWAGMQNDTLQILLYGKNISDCNIKINSKYLKINKIEKAQSPNYLFLELTGISNAKPETFDIFLSKKNKKTSIQYKILDRQKQKRGFSSNDVIYLLMPDRFANGNPKNDNNPEMLEKSDRQNPDGRHGGDIQGIIDNIDYFNKLGITTLWLNPVIENNMPTYSYHGYSATDFYKVDPRMGNNELYRKFVETAHSHNLKVIQDVIFNHCGKNHWWLSDLPFDDWINNNENSRTTYRGSVLFDPYASQADKKQFSDAWFVATMPDLNQKNPFLSQYLIQNAIWWVEYAQLDGLRIDTYPYPDQNFMYNLTQRLHTEYPDLTLLGETWLQKTPMIACFQKDSKLNCNIKGGLNSITDFPLFYAIKDAFNEDDGWTQGTLKIYYTLAQDFLYSNPFDNVIFVDNHDVDRYFSAVNEDMDKFKMGLVVLLTTRGIPVIQYGTEIAMTGLEHQGHGTMRKDFPGGWENEKTNVFTQQNMSATQIEAFNFVKKILNWRKNNIAVRQGKLIQFVPEDSVYVYFRYTDNQAVMVILNNDKNKSKEIKCDRFSEILKNYTQGTEIITNKKITNLNTIEISPKTVMLIELR